MPAFFYSSLRAKRSNPWRNEASVDCFVARAPRNDGISLGARRAEAVGWAKAFFTPCPPSSFAQLTPAGASMVGTLPPSLCELSAFALPTLRLGPAFFYSSLRAKRSNPWCNKASVDCFVASAFARRRASADKSAPRNDGISSRARRAADIDHVAVAGRGVLVGEAGDQDAAVERDDFAILLATGRPGRTDVILAAR